MKILIPVITLGAVLVALNGCGEAPVASLEAAKGALEKAHKAGALRYAQPTYRYAESMVRVGWMEMARQNGRFALLRDYDKADSLLLSAQAMARHAEEKAGDSLTFLKERTGREQLELAAEMNEWRESVEGSLIRAHAEKYLSSARLNYGVAKRLAQAEEYEEAIKALDKVRHSLHRVGIIASNYADEEADQIGVWRRWVNETLQESRRGNSYAIIVDKSARKTYLVNGGALVKTYDCDLGFNPGRQKMLSGDGATPEGKYRVTKWRPTGSVYYKALLLNYPNEMDQKRFKENKQRGVVSRNARIGGLIEIHGHGGRNEDWTLGCVALTNADMDHLMRHTTTGTPVTIVRKSDRWP